MNKHQSDYKMNLYKVKNICIEFHYEIGVMSV